MKNALQVLLLLSAGVVLMDSSVPAAHAEQELIVSAAASLTNAFGQLGKKFEVANPGIKVIFNFAASGPLLKQIEQGAPVDVFASADQKTMDQAQEKGLLLTETRKDFASNALVLIVPREAKTPIRVLEDLGGKDFARISLGKPESVPAGRYAQEALVNHGLWDKLKDKFVYSDSVRQVLDYVSRGEVDAGLVFASDALIAQDKVRVVTSVDRHQTILYPIAIIKGTEKQTPAQRFVDFVLGTEGQDILLQYGFGSP